MLPLHIFEDPVPPAGPRPARHAGWLRIFGVIAIKAGREAGADGVIALHEIGCTAELRYAEAYADGRFDIIVTGTDRFRLLDVERPSRCRAEIELLPD